MEDEEETNGRMSMLLPLSEITFSQEMFMPSLEEDDDNSAIRGSLWAYVASQGGRK